MCRRLTVVSSILLAVLLLVLAGCAANKQSAPPEPLQPGQPVPYETTYFIPQGEKRIYFASEQDLRIALARQAAQHQADQNASPPR